MGNFMNDRYGADELTTTLGIGGMIIALAGTMAHVRWISWIAIAIIVVAILRALSKNRDARSKENQMFCTFAAKVPGLNKLVAGMSGSAATASSYNAGGKASKKDLERARRMAKRMWKERKTTAFLKCPNCGQVLSVPKGKGKIRVTCPKCHAKMETKS